MKKLLLVLLVVIMALSFAGCAQETVTVEETEAATESAKVYNVVSLVNGNLGDKSFFDSAESGLKALADAGRITYKTIEMGGTDQDQ
ncbi:MAG: BMP family ABC transporter substrate-binding protein, partial [Anaerolineales bacterium]